MAHPNNPAIQNDQGLTVLPIETVTENEPPEAVWPCSGGEETCLSLISNAVDCCGSTMVAYAT
jgi:hypothetical protein